MTRSLKFPCKIPTIIKGGRILGSALDVELRFSSSNGLFFGCRIPGGTRQLLVSMQSDMAGLKRMEEGKLT